MNQGCRRNVSKNVISPPGSTRGMIAQLVDHMLLSVASLQLRNTRPSLSRNVSQALVFSLTKCVSILSLSASEGPSVFPLGPQPSSRQKELYSCREAASKFPHVFRCRHVSGFLLIFWEIFLTKEQYFSLPQKSDSRVPCSDTFSLFYVPT